MSWVALCRRFLFIERLEGYSNEEHQLRALRNLAVFMKAMNAEFEHHQKTGKWNLLKEPAEVTYKEKRDFAIQVLRFIKKIDVDFINHELTLYTKLPKEQGQDGKISFEPEPEIRKGRPPGGGNSGATSKPELLVASGNSSNFSFENTKALDEGFCIERKNTA